MALRFNRLTRPSVRALKPGERISEHGIVAECQGTGDIRYSVNIIVGGQRIHRVIGRESEGLTREQAERAIETFRTKAREGRLDLPTACINHRSFAEATAEYLKRIEHHAKNGRNIARKRQHLNERLTPYFKAHRPDKLSDFTIAHYAPDRRKKGVSDATINRELSTLSHFLNRCVEWGWAKAKPKISKGLETRKQITVLTSADKKALRAAGAGDQDLQTWLFVDISMGTGMRHSEVLRIRWDEIDFEQRRIYIGKAKAGQREQPIPRQLDDILNAEWCQLGKPQGYLLPTKRADAKHPHRSTMVKQFRRSVERAELRPDKVTPQVLRHTAIISLVKAGVDLPTIQKISGHKTLTMVLRYTQISDSHFDSSVAKLDAAFADTVTPELHTLPKAANE